MTQPAARRSYESASVQIGVGLFVSVALIGFVWLLVVLRLGPDRYPLVAEFDILDAGINEATKVKLRGYTVGAVESIEFRPVPPEGEPYFLVTLGIETQYPVPRGAVARIRGSGLVGEKYVDLDVLAAERVPLAAGARVPGEADVEMKSLMDKLRDAAEKLGGAGKALRDAQLGERLGDLTVSVDRVADDLGTVSRSADSLLLAGRHTVIGLEPGMARSLQSLERTMARLAVTMERTDTLMAATSHDVQGAVRGLREVVQRLDGVLARVDTLVAVQQTRIDSTMVNVHASSAAVREISENPWKLLIGRGDGQVAEEMGASPSSEEER
jgi:ABC-type transporter Mla subunit MlaD